MRHSTLVEAHVRAILISKRVTEEGEIMPYFQTELSVRLARLFQKENHNIYFRLARTQKGRRMKYFSSGQLLWFTKSIPKVPSTT